jgi:hypothetical protein
VQPTAGTHEEVAIVLCTMVSFSKCVHAVRTQEATGTQVLGNTGPVGTHCPVGRLNVARYVAQHTFVSTGADWQEETTGIATP